ncbi:polysaccharide deacetylase [Selenomonas sp. oral taxon 137 str. F0430]|uniref:polysaccharide deacetylase family protein n=1 Tax=Selenomonas sp. oral taxon 137 TaxID=712531 RepID=UPI0001EB2CA3|nr:polysaccharide deacetylase family protein [Selenomonas sp. oral taxon 137]EFR40096.1 polysaccharide deacetylase [Selenomonas sp. oral taxon 137 str. F0430]
MGKIIRRLLMLPLWALLGLFAWLITAPPPAGFPILEYHMVTEEVRPGAEPYVVPPAEFAAQLDYLRREGYTTITPQDYARARKGKQVLPEKPVILSFDDGYEDNHRVILPMLDERGMKGVFYIVTNDIGQPGYMTWDNLRALESHGMEIGSHTANHIPLTTLTREQQLDEIRLSKLLLEWNGMKTIYSFSYPNGSYDDVIVDMLAEENYLTAVTGEAGLNTTETDPYRLRRINIPPPHFGLWEFRLRLFKGELAARLETRMAELPEGVRQNVQDAIYLLRRS